MDKYLFDNFSNDNFSFDSLSNLITYQMLQPVGPQMKPIQTLLLPANRSHIIDEL